MLSHEYSLDFLAKSLVISATHMSNLWAISLNFVYIWSCRRSPDNFSRDNIAGLHGSNVVVIKCPPPPPNSDRVKWSDKIWPCLQQPRKHSQMKHFWIQLGLWRSKLKISDSIKFSWLDFPIINEVSKVFGLPSSALSILLDKNYIGHPSSCQGFLTRVRPRFFDQTTNASIGNKYFFTR